MLAFALVPGAAQAATQTVTDPADAPAGASGRADLRSLAWDVGPTSASLTVSLDQSTYGASLRAQIGVHVLIDSSADGLADHEIVATRNPDGVRVDVKLRTLDQIGSTTDCQELTGVDSGAATTVDATLSGGLETFTFSFDPALVAPGLATFRWTALAQAPLDSGGPWDVMPDVADAAPALANPGERTCGPGKAGISVRVKDGIAFPDPPAPPPGPPPIPVVVLALPHGQPQAGAVATVDASATVIAPGAHVVAYAWDVDGDGRTDTNTGPNPVVHLPTSGHAQTVHVSVMDSNHNSASGTVEIDPAAARANCETSASIRILRITAACITKHGDVTTASGMVESSQWDRYVVEMNGLSFVTGDPAATVTFDEAHNTIVGHGDFVIKSLNSPDGDITWYESGPDGFHWPMPTGVRGTARIASLGVENGDDCQDSDASHCFRVAGFPITGQIGVGIDTGTLDAVLDVQISIHSGIDVTTGVRLRASLALGGIQLDSLRFRIENATFGVLTLKQLGFVYEPPGTGDPIHDGGRWDVLTGIEVRTPHIEVHGRMIFEDGQFNYASADVLFNPGILLYAGVFMNHFGASFGINPTRVGGLLGLSLVSVLQIDGTWDFLHLPDGTDALRLGGRASIVDGGGEIGRLSMEFWNDGYFSYSGRLGYSFPSDSPVFEMFGQTDFWVEAEPAGARARYQGHGQLAVAFHGVNIASMEMFINNDWAAGCGFGMRGIHSYHRGIPDVVQIVLAHCDVDDYTIQPTRPHEGILPADSRSLTAGPALAAPEGRSFTVAAGQRALVLDVAGVGGAPRVTLADPKGRIYTPTATPDTARPVVDGAFASSYLPSGGITLLRVERPIAGTWVLTPQTGSPAIGTVTRSTALAPLKIRARVTGHGRTRTLSWDAPGLAGRTIRFVERGSNVGQTIAVTAKRSGSVRWTLQDGSAGRRMIQAQLTSDKGIPAGTPVVAHFIAPGPPRPARVGWLTLRRSGETVRIRWPRLRHADGYAVAVTGSDGRREHFFPPGRTPSVSTLRVAPSTSLRVTVAGWIGNPRITGPPRRAKLAAVRSKS